MNAAKDWSRSWEGSSDPSKQRKFRDNAPHHQRKKFLHAHLAESPRDKIGTRSVPVRTGDKVEVMRGDFSGETGRVDDIDVENEKIYVDGIETEAVDESESPVPLRPSNLKITRLDLDDPLRLEKYEVTEEEKEEISVEPEEEEVEEVEGEQEEEETEDEAEEDVEDSTDEEEQESGGPDYGAVVEGTIDEVKEAVTEEGLDAEKVLEAETENKDRVTLVEWLENRSGGDEDE